VLTADELALSSVRNQSQRQRWASRRVPAFDKRRVAGSARTLVCKAPTLTDDMFESEVLQADVPVLVDFLRGVVRALQADCAVDRLGGERVFGKDEGIQIGYGDRTVHFMLKTNKFGVLGS
jgi:hypothetical protein